MKLKFKHEWEEQSDGYKKLTTTLDAGVQYLVAEFQLDHRVDFRSHIEKKAEERLRREIYDLPAEEFHRALHEFLRHCCPYTPEPAAFEKAKNRLVELSGYLQKQNTKP